MVQIYVIGGVSGSGKTFFRTHHPVLRDLDCIDIAEVYRTHADSGGIVWREALEAFIGQIAEHLEERRGDGVHCSVVVEAFFRRGGPQREE